MVKPIAKIICFFFLFFACIAYSQSTLTMHYELYGITGEMFQNVKLRLTKMQSEQYGRINFSRAKWLSRRGKIEIKKGLEPYGFFKAKITSSLIKKNGIWTAIYIINPGEPLRITSFEVKITGQTNGLKQAHDYIHAHSLKLNDVFSVPRYNQFKTKLFQLVKNQGYLRAYFNNKILIDLIQYTCRIFIHLETGPQFYFGKVTFKTYPYAQSFMQKFITFKEGQVFSSLYLLQLQQKMEKSYYFKRVVFKPNFKEIENLSVPIDVYLFPPPAERYSLGVGYGTLTGPRILGGMSLRHIGNHGHHLEAELKLSSVLSGVAATYYIPGNDLLTEEWLLGANYKYFRPKAGRSYATTLTGGYNKKFENAQLSLNLNYLTERFIIFSTPPSQSAHMFYPSLSLSFIKADNIANPHQAYSINLIARAATEKLLSTTSFASLQTRLKAIITPFYFSRILLRGDLGATAVHQLRVYPLSLRFFAGGITSIRGFADSSIGPGKYLAVGSTEYQHRLYKYLFGAIFYDVGYATNHFPTPSNRGAGVGLVYDTRLGPLKIYLARAISKKTQPYSLEFSMGPEFA